MKARHLTNLANFQVGLSREDLLLGWERYANSDSADVNIQIEANKPEEQRFELNPDHTHYIIVRDDTIHRTGINQFTLRFERSVTHVTADVVLFFVKCTASCMLPACAAIESSQLYIV